MSAPRRGEAGFTLIELVVSLLLLALVVDITAQLLGETQQMLVDAGRQAPVVIEFDPEGNVVNSFGDPSTTPNTPRIGRDVRDWATVPDRP